MLNCFFKRSLLSSLRNEAKELFDSMQEYRSMYHTALQEKRDYENIMDKRLHRLFELPKEYVNGIILLGISISDGFLSVSYGFKANFSIVRIEIHKKYGVDEAIRMVTGVLSMLEVNDDHNCDDGRWSIDQSICYYAGCSFNPMFFDSVDDAITKMYQAYPDGFIPDHHCYNGKCKELAQCSGMA